MRIDKYRFRLLVIVLLTFLNITNINKEPHKPLTDEQLEFIKKDIVKPDNLSQK